MRKDVIIPASVDVLLPRKPVSNYVLMTLISIVSLITIVTGFPESYSHYFVAGGAGKPTGFLLSVFLHTDYFHLLGNMVFQWVFGNAVCAKIGNRRYLLLYFFFAFVSAVTHTLFSATGVVGASGAINGIIGFYFVLYPKNYIYIFYWFYISLAGKNRVPGYWLILSWFIMDIWGAVNGEGMVAYWAHLGGFAVGFATATLMLKMHWVEFHRIDQPHLFEKKFGRFNVDVLNEAMIRACESLGEKELLVMVRGEDEKRVDAQFLARQMICGKAFGNDEIYDETTGEWLEFSKFFGQLALRIAATSQQPLTQNPASSHPAQVHQQTKTVALTGYYIHQHNQSFGPYQMHELQNFLNDGRITIQTPIYDGLNWLTVADLCDAH